MRKLLGWTLVASLGCWFELSGSAEAQSVCGDGFDLDYRFSFTSDSTGLPQGPGDLLEAGPELCTNVGTDVDAFSYLDNFCCFAPPATALILYSVDRPTRGFPGTVRNQEDCDGSAGDIYALVLPGPLGPFLARNAPLLGLVPDGMGIPESDLDALDLNKNCPPTDSYVFSETGLPDLTFVSPGGPPTPLTGPPTLPGDDIDALGIAGTACFTYSLTPGSPTLTTFGYHPGDLLCASTIGIPLVFLSHFALGMCPLGTPGCETDNLDAVWLQDPGEDLGIIVVEWNPGVAIVPDFDPVHVFADRPIMIANSARLEPGFCEPIVFEVTGLPDTRLVVPPGEALAIPGLPAAPPQDLTVRTGGGSGATIYTYTVHNVNDSADAATGTILVVQGPFFEDGFESGDTSRWTRTVGSSP